MFLLHHPLFKLSWLILALSLPSKAAATDTKPGCQPNCGNLTITYPFGIGEGCYLARRFDITCNTSYDPPKSFISDSNFEVVDISTNQVRVKNFAAYYCYNESGKLIPGSGELAWINLTDSPYTFSDTANKFIATGCNTLGMMEGIEGILSGCVAVCNKIEAVDAGSCSGVGCCQTPIPKGLKTFQTAISLAIANDSNISEFNPCRFAFLADHERFIFDPSYLTGNVSSFIRRIEDIPVVLDWAVSNQTCQEAQKNTETYACHENSTCHDSDNGPGYRCTCHEGYEGNPYLSPGCQDINECENPNNPCEGICINTPGSFNCACPRGTYGDGRKNGRGCIAKNKKFPITKVTLGLAFGLLFLFVGISCLYFSLKKQKLTQLREKFFEQNGGLYLQQQIAFHDGARESTKIFTAQELEKATDNYSENRIIGRGGNGIVYKGLLPDNKIIAIKKSSTVDQSQIKQFINEVLVVSQINHRNVVKLVGCCLETEVPSLVYEYISNGTLYYHLHNKNGIYSISWTTRLRIAVETASALAYLHSAASNPIIHRDIKSANILLDHKYNTKVSDFGSSRLIPIDECQVTTLVQGTLGYLDPEYFQTSQLTEKSDVYSFGVVLAELLTGELPISFDRPEHQRNLASYFVLSMQQNHLLHILDPRVGNEGNRNQIIAVAELAKRCLSLKGEERPTMKEVVVDLEGLAKAENHPWVPANHEETLTLLDEALDLQTIRSSSSNPCTGLSSAKCSTEISLIPLAR